MLPAQAAAAAAAAALAQAAGHAARAEAQARGQRAGGAAVERGSGAGAGRRRAGGAAGAKPVEQLLRGLATTRRKERSPSVQNRGAGTGASRPSRPSNQSRRITRPRAPGSPPVRPLHMLPRTTSTHPSSPADRLTCRPLESPGSSSFSTYCRQLLRPASCAPGERRRVGGVGWGPAGGWEGGARARARALPCPALRCARSQPARSGAKAARRRSPQHPPARAPSTPLAAGSRARWAAAARAPPRRAPVQSCGAAAMLQCSGVAMLAQGEGRRSGRRLHVRLLPRRRGQGASRSVAALRGAGMRSSSICPQASAQRTGAPMALIWSASCSSQGVSRSCRGAPGQVHVSRELERQPSVGTGSAQRPAAGRRASRPGGGLQAGAGAGRERREPGSGQAALRQAAAAQPRRAPPKRQHTTGALGDPPA